MNEEQNAKLDWCFKALKYLVDNIALLNEADRIQLDYEVEETSLPSKTENALRGLDVSKN